MLSSLKKLRWYQVAATDERVGLVDDLYLDTESWDVRFVVVEQGALLWRQRRIIPTLAIRSVEPRERQLRLRLSRAQFARCPKSHGKHRSTNRAPRAAGSLCGWLGRGAIEPSVSTPETSREQFLGATTEHSSLRSARDLIGYRIQALNEEVGRLDDLLVDLEAQSIPVVVISTRRWFRKRKRELSSNRIQGISGANKRVFVDLTSDRIRDDPAFAPTLSTYDAIVK